MEDRYRTPSNPSRLERLERVQEGLLIALCQSQRELLGEMVSKLRFLEEKVDRLERLSVHLVNSESPTLPVL